MLHRLRHWLRRLPRRILLSPFGGEVREVTISPTVVRDLCLMARSSWPKEMISYLSATAPVQDGRLHIDEIQLQAYDASTHSATTHLHLLPPVTNIVGTLHSHPTRAYRPSDADLSLFSHFGLVHGIIRHPYNGFDDIAFYDKEGRRVPVRLLVPQ